MPHFIPNLGNRWSRVSTACISRFVCMKVEGKAISLQAWTEPEVSRRFRLPDFKTIGTLRWYVCQTYAPAARNITLQVIFRAAGKIM